MGSLYLSTVPLESFFGASGSNKTGHPHSGVLIWDWEVRDCEESMFELGGVEGAVTPLIELNAYTTHGK